MGLLISIPIFVLILQHRKIRSIAAFTDVMPFNSFTHGTTWLVGMCAVVETAILGKIENLLEVMPHFLAFHVEGTKALDAWCVDDIRTWHERVLYRIHLREGSGMLSRIEGIGNLSCPQVQVWEKPIDERRFSHATISAEQGDIVRKQFS